jgi:hypothetical protein
MRGPAGLLAQEIHQCLREYARKLLIVISLHSYLH